MARIILIIRLLSILSGWYTRASADGKIDPSEIADLITQVAGLFDVDFKLPDNFLPS